MATKNKPSATGNEYMPTFDESLEDIIIASFIIEREAQAKMMPRVRPEMFYIERNRTLFEAIRDMVAEGKPVDMLTLADYLRTLGKLDEVGGPVHIMQITGKLVSTAHLEYHCAVLFDMYTRRQLVELLDKYLTQAKDRTFDHYEVMVSLNNDLNGMMENSPLESHLHTMEEVADMTVSTVHRRQETSRQGLTGVPTGLPELDALTGGWQPGNLITNAGRPGDGKSALDVSFALAAAKAGVPVVYFTLEMSAAEVGERLVLAESHADPAHVKRGQLTADENADFEAAAARMAKLPIYIDDTPSISIDRLCAQMRGLKFRGKVGLLIVDYLQLIGSSLTGRNREQEVAECSRKLKMLARSLQCPVIVSSQLNRQAEDQTTPPDLRHLRESGAIEQDADLVLMIHRPERHHVVEDQQLHCSTKGMGILNVAKHRNGSTGRVCYSYNSSMTRITAFVPQPFSDDELHAHRTQAEQAQRNSRRYTSQQPGAPWWVFKKKSSRKQSETPKPDDRATNERTLFSEPQD